MKKKIICIIGLALFVGAIAFNFQINSVNNDQLSDVTLKNIEALAAPGDEDDMTMQECVDQYCPFEGSLGCEAICDGYIMIIWYQWNGVYI